MSNTKLQVTIRGLDARTKAALVKNARNRGVSFNQYALTSLKQAAGVQERYSDMKDFLKHNRISDHDHQQLDEAVQWLNETSLSKQKQEEDESTL